jgi:hypothetical protein
MPGSVEGLVDSDFPLVELMGLPGHHYQPSGRARRPADVGEAIPINMDRIKTFTVKETNKIY